MYAIKQNQGARFFGKLADALKFKAAEEHEKKIRVDIYKRMVNPAGYVHFEKMQ